MVSPVGKLYCPINHHTTPDISFLYPHALNVAKALEQIIKPNIKNINKYWNNSSQKALYFGVIKFSSDFNRQRERKSEF